MHTKQLIIPEKIMIEDHRTIDHIYSIIHSGCFSARWLTFNVQLEITEDLKEKIAQMKDTLYVLVYTCMENVEIFSTEFSFPMKRELRAAKFKNLKRLQEKIVVLDVGDKTIINLISDEAEGNNICIDTLAKKDNV